MSVDISHLQEMDTLTNAEKYGPAMEIRNQEDADKYLNALVEYYTNVYGISIKSAKETVKWKLGYYARYYNIDVMERINRLFRISHPIFGL